MTRAFLPLAACAAFFLSTATFVDAFPFKFGSYRKLIRRQDDDANTCNDQCPLGNATLADEAVWFFKDKSDY